MCYCTPSIRTPYCHNCNQYMRTEIESLRQQLAECERERDELHQVCRDAYEVWAGSEGIPEPVYASEAYLYQLLINMRDEVKRGIAKVGAYKTGEK